MKIYKSWDYDIEVDLVWLGLMCLCVFVWPLPGLWFMLDIALLLTSLRITRNPPGEDEHAII